ncbi:hypothetical protein GCM10023107_83290 [Actinoplanes octamycinicus]
MSPSEPTRPPPGWTTVSGGGSEVVMRTAYPIAVLPATEFMERDVLSGPLTGRGTAVRGRPGGAARRAPPAGCRPHQDDRL